MRDLLCDNLKIALTGFSFDVPIALIDDASLPELHISVLDPYEIVLTVCPVLHLRVLHLQPREHSQHLFVYRQGFVVVASLVGLVPLDLGVLNLESASSCLHQ